MTDAPPSSGSRLRLVRASAGTGKTYALTVRYLALVRGGADPATVLATTFTRKAAGEVFGRVLTRLADAVTDREAREKLDADLRGEGLLPGAMPALTRGDAEAMLARLVDDLDRVAISTIDSFFARMCSAFAMELGVPTDPVMTDDRSALAGELRWGAIEALLGEAAERDFSALLMLLRQLHHDGAKRSVTASLDRLFTGEPGGMYGVYRQAREPEKWPALETPGAMGEEERVRCIEALAEAEDFVPRTKAGQPSRPWLNALRSDVAKAHAQDWEGLLKAGLVKAAWGTGMFSGKPIPEELAALYLPLARHAVTQIVQRYNLQTRSTHALLEHFAGHFEQRCRQQRVMLFADLTDALVRKLRDHPDDWSDELAYRLDGKAEHLLVDEFQDTSVDQFAVLWPLIDESSADSSSGRTFFCVGDAKQSIYGWRGGRPELFDKVADLLGPRGLTEAHLSESFRSSAAVMTAVNRVFGGLTTSASWGKDAEALSRFTATFETHRAAKDVPGEVVLATTRREGDADDDLHGITEQDGDFGDSGREADDGVGAHYRAVAEHIKALRSRHPGAEIGVLAPTHAQLHAMLHALRCAEVDAAGESGAALTDHPAVGAVLSAMVLADHPDDTVAAFHVANTPLGEVIGLRDHQSPAARRAASTRLRRALADRGYAAVVSGWAAALAPACDAMGLGRLAQLARLAERYQPTTWLRATAFVRFVERSSVEDPASTAVRVMTIHRAKGLEFDIVVLPALHGSIPFRQPVLEQRGDPAGPIDAVYRAGSKEVRALSKALETLYDQERQRFVYERLCSLYVAMTRAKFGLHLLIPPTDPQGRGGGQTYASLLAELLAPGEDRAEPDVELYRVEHGGGLDATPLETSTGSATERAESDNALPPQWPLRAVDKRRQAAVAPSGRAGAPATTAVDLLSARGNAATVFGSRVHGFFESVGFVDDADPSHDAVLAALRGVDPTAASHVETALAAEEVRAALCQRGAAGLWREHPFAMLDDNGRTVRGTIDRVVWWTDENGKPTRAEVMDFKTDVVDGDAALAERVEHHRPQVEVYRRAAAGLLRLELEHVAGVLVFTGAGRGVRV